MFFMDHQPSAHVCGEDDDDGDEDDDANDNGD